jgi:ferredoxin-NADP reductase
MEEKDSECLVNLLYVNKTERDIMMKDELDRLKKENSDNLNIYYCCTREKNSNYICKRPDKDILEKTIYNKDGNTTYLLCGPTHFVNTVNSILRNLNVNPHNILIF